MNNTTITSSEEKLKACSACDIADALLKLKVPNAGILSDLHLRSSLPGIHGATIVARASTVLFVPKDSEDLSFYPPPNIPSGEHWADLQVPDTIVVISQPPGQKNAVLGGIMALRGKVLGIKGYVVCGRIRDEDELGETGLPCWSSGKSSVGAGLASKAWAVEVPLDLEGTLVKPGDWVVCDTLNDIVVIPQEKLEEVLSMLPGLWQADERVKEDVKKGISVQEAFKKHRTP